MNTFSKLTRKTLFVLLSLFSVAAFAQTQHTLNNNNSDIVVEGTSNVHDWEMEAENLSGKLNFVAQANELKEITDASLRVKAEHLKSGKSKMDSNAYEALKTDDYAEIKFNYSSTKNISKIADNKYKATITGKLTIAGETKTVNLDFEFDLNQKIITGSFPIDMTQYGIDPPTAVFGTIKTGESVTVKFTSKF
ncbi:MAG: YceI family protein [Bacteroidota bacterium]